MYVCVSLGRGKSRTAISMSKMTRLIILTVAPVAAARKGKKKTWIKLKSMITVMTRVTMSIIVLLVANTEKEEKMKEEGSGTRNRGTRTPTPENIAVMEEERRKIMATTIGRMIGTMCMAIGESLTPLTITNSKDMEVEEETMRILLIAGVLTATTARTPMASRDTHRSHPATMTEEEATGIRTIAAILPCRARTNIRHETITTRGPGVARVIQVIVTMTAAVGIIAETIFRETARIRIEISSQGTTTTITTGARITASNASPTDTIIPCHPEARIIIAEEDWREGEN